MKIEVRCRYKVEKWGGWRALERSDIVLHLDERGALEVLLHRRLGSVTLKSSNGYARAEYREVG